MAYVLSKSPTLTAKVEVTEPGNAPDGSVENFTFVAVFRRLDSDELDALLKSNKPIRTVLADLLAGWSDLRDATGQELPFTTEYRDSLLKIPHAVVGLWGAFLEAHSGAARKN
ncbi:hypothetical protein [Paraburkholderia guartelaensis]|uniref:Uncharacterized protein n=1 Tax=Paraburkholderia guartelaensis TaxID=2546446 RepID=A0ABU9SET1_9BURK